MFVGLSGHFWHGDSNVIIIDYKKEKKKLITALKISRLRLAIQN
jgi:hypothetical protein